MMYKLTALFACVALTLGSALAHGDHGHHHHHDHDHDHNHDDDVLVLGADNFDEVIAASPAILVEFYAPWCGHCKQLAPEYAAAAHALHDVAPLGKVDCDQEANKDLCGKYGVRGFPTLKLFRNDGSQPADYNKGRDAKSIEAYVRFQTGPAVETLQHQKDFDTFMAANPLSVVLFAEGGSSNDIPAGFSAAAESFRESMAFAVCTSDVVRDLQGLTSGTIRMHRDFTDNVDFVYEGDEVDQEALQQFVLLESFPLVGDISPETFQQYLDRGLPLGWLFLDMGGDNVEAVVSHVTGAAAATKGEISFVKLDGVKWEQHAKNFGVTTLPGLVVEDKATNKKYLFEGDVNVEAELVAFAEGVVAGTVAPHRKSAPVPTTQDTAVVNVVALNFDEVVLDEAKDVFVEFYAPWCGHCKKLAPEWETLAEDFAGEESVVIAALDAEANDAPPQVRGFPTLIFYPAGEGAEAMVYKGDRTKDALAEFVRANAKAVVGGGAEEQQEQPKHEEL